MLYRLIVDSGLLAIAMISQFGLIATAVTAFVFLGAAALPETIAKLTMMQNVHLKMALLIKIVTEKHLEYDALE